MQNAEWFFLPAVNISWISGKEKEYAESSRLLRFLDNFYSIPSDCVPKQSIIREFIGGSEFKY